MSRRIAIVVGMKQEARAAQAPLTLVGGGSAMRVRRLLAEAGPLDGVISFGIAGGLADNVRPGEIVLAERILAHDDAFHSDPRWLKVLGDRLPGARVGALAGVDAMIGTRRDKAALRKKTGAKAVDMESHGAALFARDANLPFVALRAVADPHHRALPPAALVGMKPDGSADIAAVIKALALSPRQLPALIVTAREARAGMKALLGSRRLLGPLFGFDDRV